MRTSTGDEIPTEFLKLLCASNLIDLVEQGKVEVHCGSDDYNRTVYSVMSPDSWLRVEMRYDQDFLPRWSVTDCGPEFATQAMCVMAKATGP